MTEIQQTKEAIAKAPKSGIDDVCHAWTVLNRHQCTFTERVKLADLKALAADHTRLASEIERLREALESTMSERDTDCTACNAVAQIAQAALQPPIQGDEV